MVRRIRYLKPEFFGDTKLGLIAIEVRYLFAGLWTIMDMQGLCEFDLLYLKREIFPYDAGLSPKMIGEMLDALMDPFVGILRLIEFDGKNYIHCPNFARHQKFHPKEKPQVAIDWKKIRIIKPAVSDPGQPPAGNVPAVGRPENPTADRPETGIGIGTETGTGIETGTGTGIGTGTDETKKNPDLNFSNLDQETLDGQKRLEAKRKSLGIIPGGVSSFAKAGV